MANKNGRKPDASDDLEVPHVLNPPLKSITAEQFDHRSKSSVSEAHLVENEETKERFVRLLNRYRPPGRDAKIGAGFNIYRGDALSKLLGVLRRFAQALGWKMSGLTDESLEKQTEAITAELAVKNNEIVELREQLSKSKAEKEEYIAKIQVKHDAELLQLRKDTQRLRELDEDIVKFKSLLSRFETEKLSEEDVQKFLEGKKWFFGSNVVAAKPKSRAGATTIFDFILTYTDGTQRVVELKLPTEAIVDGEGRLTAAVAKGLDQLIDYLKQTIAIAHTDLPEAQYIKEKRPRGTLVIGRSRDDQTLEKMKSWNYALHLVEIKTYDQLIADAETSMKQIKGEIKELTA